MTTYNVNKHGVRYSVTGNLANKLASLTDDGAKVSVRLQFGRTPAGTRLSMAASCFGVLWAAEQNAERCEGTATRWQSAAKNVLLIKWDGWSRATATTIEELDDAKNDVRILHQGDRT